MSAWPLYGVGTLGITTWRHMVEPSLVAVMITLGVVAVAKLLAARRARSTLFGQKEQRSRSG